MESNLCRFCSEQSELIEAHIVPKSFYDAIKSDRQDLFVLKGKNRTITKSGVCDNGILCHKCDNLLGKYDNAAIRFFRLDFRGSNIRKGLISMIKKAKRK